MDPPLPAAKSLSRDKTNGRDRTHDLLDPHKLTVEQQEALALLLSLGNPSIRRAGVSEELARRASYGEAVPSEAIVKLVAFLAG